MASEQSAIEYHTYPSTYYRRTDIHGKKAPTNNFTTQQVAGGVGIRACSFERVSRQACARAHSLSDVTRAAWPYHREEFTVFWRRSPPWQIKFHMTKRKMCLITNGFDSLPVERQYKNLVSLYNVQDTSALKFYNYISYITEQRRKCHGLYGVNNVVKSNKKIFILGTWCFNSGNRPHFRLRSPNEI